MAKPNRNIVLKLSKSELRQLDSSISVHIFLRRRMIIAPDVYHCTKKECADIRQIIKCRQKLLKRIERLGRKPNKK